MNESFGMSYVRQCRRQHGPRPYRPEYATMYFIGRRRRAAASAPSPVPNIIIFIYYFLHSVVVVAVLGSGSGGVRTLCSVAISQFFRHQNAFSMLSKNGKFTWNFSICSSYTPRALVRPHTYTHHTQFARRFARSARAMECVHPMIYDPFALFNMRKYFPYFHHAY